MLATILGYFLSLFLFSWGVVFLTATFKPKATDETRALLWTLSVICFAFAVGVAKWVS